MAHLKKKCYFKLQSTTLTTARGGRHIFESKYCLGDIQKKKAFLFTPNKAYKTIAQT